MAALQARCAPAATVSGEKARKSVRRGTAVPRREAVRCRYQTENKAETHDQLVRRTAVRDVADFCKLRPELSPQCGQVHAWLAAKVEQLEQGKALQQPATAAAAGGEAHLLQHTLNEIVSCGSIEDVYKSVSMLKQMEERRLQGHSHHHQHEEHGASGDHAPSTPLPRSCIGEQERLLLTRLFESMDTNRDGRLSWSEFTSALHNIDDDLDEEEMELVSTALDLHGTLSLDEFLAVVEKAEEARDEAECDARRLRHLTHRRPDQVDRLWGSCL